MTRAPRRHPRYGSFLITGGLLGLLATVLVIIGPAAHSDSRRQLFFYLGLLLVGIGALLAGLVAVLLEGSAPKPRREDAPEGPIDP